MTGPLGRKRSPDDEHIRRYPFSLLTPGEVPVVEKTLPLWSGADAVVRKLYDQGSEGACVGFSCSWMMTILNRRRYAARWLYQQAQLIDPWSDTPPEEGTDVRSAFEILKDIGHRRLWGSFTLPAFLADGIAAYRWATTVSQTRTAISLGMPCVWGVNWYENFDNPVLYKNEWWVGIDPANGLVLQNLGAIRGGHAIVQRGASDKRQAIRWTNTWGLGYPDVYVPYAIGDRLIHEAGEVGLITDR